MLTSHLLLLLLHVVETRIRESPGLNHPALQGCLARKRKTSVKWKLMVPLVSLSGNNPCIFERKKAPPSS